MSFGKLAATAFALAALQGCKAADPKNPATWISRLSDADSKVRAQAVRELRKLKAKEAAPQVARLLRDPLVREEAAIALADLGGPNEVQPLLDAIDTAVGAGSDQAARAANRTNARIAASLGTIGDPRGGPALLRLARANDDAVRLEAVQSLGLMRHREAIPELSRIVDDESAPPLLAKKAVAALGQMGDPAAISALTHALVLERQGVTLLPEASYALFLFGKDAVEPLLRIGRDQDAAYLSWAKEANRPAAGTYAMVALVLGDLGDARAIPVLLDLLKYRDADPNPATARLLTNHVRKFATNALGRLRAKEAAEPILALVDTKDAQNEELTGAAAESLVWIGDRAQALELLRRAQVGQIRLRLLAAQAASLLGGPSLRKDLAAIVAKERRVAPLLCVKQLAELGVTDAQEKPCELLAAQFEGLFAPLAAAQECGDRAACWEAKLSLPDAVLRARAAYELGRLGSASSVPALVQRAADSDLLPRVAAVRALEWLIPVPTAQPELKAAAAQLAAQLAAEGGKAQLVKVNEELRRLQIRLARL